MLIFCVLRRFLYENDNHYVFGLKIASGAFLDVLRGVFFDGLFFLFSLLKIERVKRTKKRGKVWMNGLRAAKPYLYFSF